MGNTLGPKVEVVKTDVNDGYRTHGLEGEHDYVIDRNIEYQPSGTNEITKMNERISTEVRTIAGVQK